MMLDVFLRNVGLSTVLKLSTFVLQFGMLPLFMKVLGKGEYGVWVVLQSLVIWVMVLELGIGKGLRNKLIESLGVGDDRLAGRYLSSTLFGQMVLWGLIACVLVVFLFLMDLPLALWLRSSGTDRTIAWSVFFCFLTFVLTQLSGVVQAILYAKHWNSATALVGFAASIGLFFYLLLADCFGRSDITGIGGGEFRFLCVGIFDSVELFVPLFSELSSAMVRSVLGYISGSCQSRSIVSVYRDYLYGDFHDGSVDCSADVRFGDGG